MSTKQHLLCALLLLFAGTVSAQQHSADTTANGAIDLAELLRVIQFYNSSGYGCQVGTEDGFAPGSATTSCAPHASDYAPQNWDIGLSELLRLIQFYNQDGYHYFNEGGSQQCESEDGFCPGRYIGQYIWAPVRAQDGTSLGIVQQPWWTESPIVLDSGIYDPLSVYGSLDSPYSAYNPGADTPPIMYDG
ncbi:MAG: hypothetical protein HC888_11245 [Candidatus Competibacteraceae bacterium]|nr:hypothetical protein [Candidatus Competibacteraceae bacterium]